MSKMILNGQYLKAYINPDTGADITKIDEYYEIYNKSPINPGFSYYEIEEPSDDTKVTQVLDGDEQNPSRTVQINALNVTYPNLSGYVYYDQYLRAISALKDFNAVITSWVDLYQGTTGSPHGQLLINSAILPEYIGNPEGVTKCIALKKGDFIQVKTPNVASYPYQHINIFSIEDNPGSVTYAQAKQFN